MKKTNKGHSELRSQFTASSTRYIDLQRGRVTFSKTMNRDQINNIMRNSAKRTIISINTFEHMRYWERCLLYSLTASFERVMILFLKESIHERKLLMNQGTNSFRRNHARETFANEKRYRYPIAQLPGFITFYRSVLDKQKMYDYMVDLQTKSALYGQSYSTNTRNDARAKQHIKQEFDQILYAKNK